MKDMEEGCGGIELIEKHGAFSAVSFRRNKGMEKVSESRVDREAWGIGSCEF
jgi:hypothetical protein